jgi:hypothetical protein
MRASSVSGEERLETELGPPDRFCRSLMAYEVNRSVEVPAATVKAIRRFSQTQMTGETMRCLRILRLAKNGVLDALEQAVPGLSPG